MTLRDSFGNTVSTGSAAARDHYDRGLRLLLGSEFGAADAFRAAIAADEGFALGHAALARALMTPATMRQAKEAMSRAEELSEKLDHRERQHVACLALALAAEPQKARTLVKTHVRDYPCDALVAQLCTSVFGLIGFSGKVGREAELLAYTSALSPHYGENWWMMSMHAISLCETGQIGSSIDLMEKSLALNPRNANAAHFKAHAQYEAGDTAAGRAYLAEWMPDYDDRGLLHGHLSWHAALWALHDGDLAAMWRAVDNGIGPGSAKGLPINTLTDTAAILYRAELAGASVDPARWAALSDYAAEVFPDPGQSFADIHAALSHAMAGRGERLARIAETTKGFADDLVRPVARTWGAIARGNWAGALEEMIPAVGATERFGGSRAQRDLLELTYANALLKLGRTAEARRFLTMRRPVLMEAPPLAAYAQ